MQQDIFVAIVGAGGRMGSQLLETAHTLDGVVIADAVVRPGSPSVGARLGPDDVHATDDVETAVENADVAVDFSTPKACRKAAALAADYGTAFVSGTTGLDDDIRAEVRGHSSDIPVLWAANFSVGINVLEQIVELAAAAAGEGFDIEILEAHHRHKVDAPSGTALWLGEAVERARGGDLGADAVFDRRGQVGERSAPEIGFQSIRGGDITGEHTVFLCGPDERLELTHRAGNRRAFARGALRAASWIADKQPGLYTMKDVLFDGS